MSKSFDAPNRIQPSGSTHGNDQMPAAPRAERRRSPRWNAHVPVFVYGHSSGRAPFHEEAYSAVVSDRGALLIMTTTVPVGEKLLLTNKVTQTEQECRVAGIGKRDGPSVEIAVEFSAADPQFWRVTAPPLHAASVSPIERHRKAR
jgi:hypothetical protein